METLTVSMFRFVFSYNEKAQYLPLCTRLFRIKRNSSSNMAIIYFFFFTKHEINFVKFPPQTGDVDLYKRKALERVVSVNSVRTGSRALALNRSVMFTRHVTSVRKTCVGVFFFHSIIEMFKVEAEHPSIPPLSIRLDCTSPEEHLPSPIKNNRLAKHQNVRSDPQTNVRGGI